MSKMTSSLQSLSMHKTSLRSIWNTFSEGNVSMLQLEEIHVHKRLRSLKRIIYRVSKKKRVRCRNFQKYFTNGAKQQCNILKTLLSFNSVCGIIMGQTGLKRSNTLVFKFVVLSCNSRLTHYPSYVYNFD